MKKEETALVLIGFQNDYFSQDGILHNVVEESLKTGNVLKNTLNLIDAIIGSDVSIISTPIVFSEDYIELVEPVGILKTIKDVGAFKKNNIGSEVIPEIKTYGNAIAEVPGKRGLNAFSNTGLGQILAKKSIKNIVLAGVVTSVCIDSTGRDAFEQGYNVYILSDCTSGRSVDEQNFYCNSIFPIYSKVLKSHELLDALI